jgi:class 3 adenylate cyclase
MDERDQLRRAITYLALQRPQLGDAVVNVSTAVLQAKLTESDTLTRTDEERRLVTVLFADLTGWRELAAALDPEDLCTVQEAYFAAVTPPILVHGGSVEKYIGDAVLAVFGVPEAHEDDPERALCAALDMQQAVAELHVAGGMSQGATELVRLQPATLHLRIGVHTGMVVSRVDPKGGWAITGDAVNLAFQLQEAAAPGSVWASDATRWLAGYAFDLEPTGFVRLRGRSDPVVAFRVLRQHPIAGGSHPVVAPKTPLVGRQGELAALQGAVLRLSAGQGGLVVVCGEVGMGKSRLISELRNTAPAGCHWVEGRCLSHGSAVAYHLWRGMLYGAIGATLDEPPELVGNALQHWIERIYPGDPDALCPYLAHMLNLPMKPVWQQQLDSTDAHTIPRRILATMEQVLVCATALRPIIMVCEDLQWADAGSLALLEGVAPLVERTPLLLICLFRPEPDRCHPTWHLQALARQRTPRLVIELQPLSAAESQALLVQLVGEALPGRLAQRVLDRADGNPFFIEEIIRSLSADGVLARDVPSGRCRLQCDVEDLAVPASLQSVMAARICRLPPRDRRVLQMASVAGRSFLYRVLAVLAYEVEDLEACLDSLEQQELIRARPGGPEQEYFFQHALIQETAYNSILRRQRQEFHRQTAEALERLYPECIGELLDVLAFHWDHSDKPQCAANYRLQASQQERPAPMLHRTVADSF